MNCTGNRYALLLGLVVLLASSHPSTSGAQTKRKASAPDSAAVRAVVENFHAALASGDSAKAAELLTDDVVVLESGDMEHRADYLARHLPADIKFAKAVPSSHDVTMVRVVGDAAWLIAISVTSGTYEGRAIRSEGAELVVLRRTPPGWRIAAVHWSSHRAR
ncbi:MAG: nuclear transport factor 2 family protein [bacterium]